ncbi:hemin uptake protein HemP [Marinobacterium marinum]|uniref:Hemin uptake protein HemP n=1 Tax=Marinobacterium marinum TaxID=2756129 RepID=A0A7W1X0B9_9GAMM|nr:hemin uptake protein HemP [Marinobacterium marinum]MBA4503434.1 hemin uptake protein HemP [Marinobacterium marinum]
MPNKTEMHNDDARNAPWIRSDELVPGPSGLVILHNDEPYRLRITRKGKLILTK